MAWTGPVRSALDWNGRSCYTGSAEREDDNNLATTNALPIFVGHNDTLLHLYLPERGDGRSFFTRSHKGHIDLPRAREGGLGGGFFAVFVPSNPAMPDSGLTITENGYELRMRPALDLPYAQQVTVRVTAAGKDQVRACDRLGIMLDLSHLNERGFWDVTEISDAPLVATHSNAHTLSPSTRNLADKQLDAIKESEGMVGLNFAVYDLRDDGHNDPDTPLDILVRHIDYLVEHLGIDCVGLGSDFDGTRIPQTIGDVTGLPKLIAALREHGYDDVSLRKLPFENWVRVLDKTWN